MANKHLDTGWRWTERGLCRVPWVQRRQRVLQPGRHLLLSGCVEFLGGRGEEAGKVKKDPEFHQRFGLQGYRELLSPF